MEHQTLGNNVIPSSYRLFISTDLGTFTFKGAVTVSVDISKPTDTILLNCKDIKVSKATVSSKGKALECAASADQESERLTLKLPEQAEGKADLHIEYEGRNGDGLYGFYRSKYDHQSKDKYMLTTQLEAANARAAFPCFDEPEFKATFEVSLEVDEALDAISNMPATGSKPAGSGRKVVSFDKTPRMSTYLLYMGVGEFDYLEDECEGKKLRIVTTPGKKELGHLPMKYIKQLLPVMEGYFGIKYPLPKLDLIAVPDFSAGAMENWGAITFRETDLLGDEEETSVSGKQRIAEVIAHETTHQWFGDLVTMKWWDDLWLNESFATFMEYKMVGKVIPEWEENLRILDYELSRAFSADAVEATHPISVEVNTPGEISEIFDAISYSKGASVLHMFEDYVGEEAFRNGLHSYLKKNSYSNATKNDLWGEIEEAAKKEKMKSDFAEVAQNWINEPGYPVIHVKRGKEGFDLKQRRFSLTGRTIHGKWLIPLHYKTGRGSEKTLMKDEDAALKEEGAFLKLNWGQRGFYRVKYDKEQLDEIGKRIAVGTSEIDAADQWGVEGDLFSLARSGIVPARDYLEFVDMYMRDSVYPANFTISDHLTWLVKMLEAEKAGAYAKEVSLRYHKRILDRLGWTAKKGESSIDTKHRGIAIFALGYVDDPDTVAKASELFDGFVQGKARIDTNIRTAVYATVARSRGSKELFDKFLDMYQKLRLPDEKVKALNAMANFRDPKLLEAALDVSLTSRIRLQDAKGLFPIIASNREARPLLFKWVAANWQKLRALYDPADNMLDRVVGGMAIYADEKTKGEMTEFFSRKGNVRDDIKRAIKQTAERIEANVRFGEANK